MSADTTPTETETSTDASDLSNDELLARVAALDEDGYPIAAHAERALATQTEESEEGSS